MQTELRTPEERIRAMHSRAAEIENRQKEIRVRVISAVSAAVSFAAVIVLALIVPGITSNLSQPVGDGDMTGSILSGSEVLGFIAVGVIAFLLGAAVTVLCVRLNRMKDGGSKENDHA